MYIVLLVVIICLLPEDFKEEIGGIIGCFVMIVYTIIYVTIFVFIDYNWTDIFDSIAHFKFRW